MNIHALHYSKVAVWYRLNRRKIGALLFGVQVGVYAAIGVFLFQSFWLGYDPTVTDLPRSMIGSFNPIYATWNGLHALALMFILICGIVIRLYLPKTPKGFVYSLAGLIFAPVIGETWFMQEYLFYYHDWANVGYLWVIGRTGIIGLWIVLVALQTYKMFSLKTLGVGLFALLIFGVYWMVDWNFVLWRSPITADNLTGFFGHFATIFYYGVWCLFYIAAFKRRAPLP